MNVNALVDIFAGPGATTPASQSSSQSQLFPPPAYSPLSVPFCLPATGLNFDDPFSRGYHADLIRCGITEKEMLEFVDGLNIAHVGSPALRVVDAVGMILGFFPSHEVLAIGAGIQIVAQTGIRVLSKSLTDRYLRASNRRYFHPRGLSARLCTTRALRVLVGMQEPTPEPSKSKKFVSGMKNVGLEVAAFLPLGPINTMIADKSTRIPGAHVDPTFTPTQRRLAIFFGYIMEPINFDVPPAPKADSVVGKTHALSVKFRERQRVRREIKKEKKREKRARKGKGEYNAALKQVVAERKDEQLVWLVLMPIDKDAQIQDIEVADAAEDVDRINMEQWRVVEAQEKERERDDSDEE